MLVSRRNEARLARRRVSKSPKKYTYPWLGKMEKLLPSTFEKTISGRSGIIFFKDCWKRGSETFENRSGDHIDLWNGSRITSSSVFTREILEFFGRVSDLNQSREIWFWEIS